MEKLIELLNQFEEEKKSDNRWGLSYVGNDLVWLWNIREARLAVISKGYWFIKRLVDNDKIDFNKTYLENCCTCWWLIRYGEVNGLIMKLSISSSPIEDLIFYIK